MNVQVTRNLLVQTYLEGQEKKILAPGRVYLGLEEEIQFAHIVLLDHCQVALALAVSQFDPQVAAQVAGI